MIIRYIFCININLFHLQNLNMCDVTTNDSIHLHVWVSAGKECQMLKTAPGTEQQNTSVMYCHITWHSMLASSCTGSFIGACSYMHIWSNTNYFIPTLFPLKGTTHCYRFLHIAWLTHNACCAPTPIPLITQILLCGSEQPVQAIHLLWDHLLPVVFPPHGMSLCRPRSGIPAVPPHAAQQRSCTRWSPVTCNGACLMVSMSGLCFQGHLSQLKPSVRYFGGRYDWYIPQFPTSTGHEFYLFLCLGQQICHGAILIRIEYQLLLLFHASIRGSLHPHTLELSLVFKLVDPDAQLKAKSSWIIRDT